MKMVTVLDEGIFTVADLFTPRECEELIAWGEAQGFEAASVATESGARMAPTVRNNDRVVFEDTAFMAGLWERARAFVPQELDGFPVTGLNPRLRFYRYDPGQRFKRHQDGRVELESGEVSRLTFLVYLNTGYEGGGTVFREYMTDAVGETVTKIVRVTPEAGMGLFFIHERKHEGAVIVSGRKYVLRTDVLYAGAPIS